MNVPLTGTVFAIGRNSKCNMQLRELSVSSLLCNLVWQDGAALIECCSNSGILSVNNRPLKKGARHGLKSGDEISISGLKPYLFVRCVAFSCGNSISDLTSHHRCINNYRHHNLSQQPLVCQFRAAPARRRARGRPEYRSISPCRRRPPRSSW